MQQYRTKSVEETIALGAKIASHLKGGEVIELLSDLGGGKTTFVKGLAEGLGSKDPVASPSFTISYVYRCADDIELHHFDFYRLQDGGVVASELAENIHDPKVITVVEWGEVVHDVLPNERIKISIRTLSENTREIHIEGLTT